MINPQQIRRGLIKLAEFKKQPHYGAEFVRSVIANFDHHPLREAVLYFCENCPKEYTARLAELRALCRSNVMIDLAFRTTGIDVRSILEGDMHITNATWDTLKTHFDALEDQAVINYEKSRVRDKVRDEFERECQFDLFLQSYLNGMRFNVKTKKYEGDNADVMNEAWLSFRDFRSSRK